MYDKTESLEHGEKTAWRDNGGTSYIIRLMTDSVIEYKQGQDVIGVDSLGVALPRRPDEMGYIGRSSVIIPTRYQTADN